MQLLSARPSSRIRRSAAICTFRLLSSTTVDGQTAAMISSRDEIPRPPDQHAENVERPRADRHRHENTALVAPEHAVPVETEAREPENIVRGGRAHASRAPRISAILSEFITFYTGLIARSVEQGSIGRSE